MNDSISGNATSSSQQQPIPHPEDSEELLVTSTSSSTTPPNNLTTNATYPASVIASSSTSPNSSSSSPFSNTNIPANICTGASPTSSSAIIARPRPFNQPSETESSAGESGGENSPPLTTGTTANAISPSTSSAGFCQIVSSSTENITSTKISSLVSYDLESEDEFDEEYEYLESFVEEQPIPQQDYSKMVNSSNSGRETGEICILPSSSSTSSYEKPRDTPNTSPSKNLNPQRPIGLGTRSGRRKLENEIAINSGSSQLGSRNLNILKNQPQPPSIIIKKTTSNANLNQQNFNSSSNIASTSAMASSSLSYEVVGVSSSPKSFMSTSYSSSSINLMKSDNLLSSGSNRLGINNNEQSQQIDNRLLNNSNNNSSSNGNNNNHSSGTNYGISGITNCINNLNNSSSSVQSENASGITSPKISIKIANKYNCINSNVESHLQNLSKSKSSETSNNSSNANFAISMLQHSTFAPTTSLSALNSSNENIEQRKVEPLKINLNRHESPIPKITIKTIKPSTTNNSDESSLSNPIMSINSGNQNITTSSSISNSSTNIPIPKLTIKQHSTSIIQNESSCMKSSSTSATSPSLLNEPHIVPKLTIKTSSDSSGNPVVQSVIVPKLTIKMDNIHGTAGCSGNNSINIGQSSKSKDHGLSPSRSSSTSPSSSSSSSPSPTEDRVGIIRNVSSDLPPLPKLTIKTSGDCVETILTNNNLESQQQKQECHIVSNTLSPTAVPKLTIKTYPKTSISTPSSTIISTCSTPTLNAILSQTDGSVVPKLTIKPIVPINVDEQGEGIIPKITIKANQNSNNQSHDSTTVYSAELQPISAGPSKNFSSNSTDSQNSKETHSIPKLTIRTKQLTNSTTTLESNLSENDIENEKVVKFSKKHSSHLDVSQPIPKLTIHVNETSSGNSSGHSSSSNVTSGDRTIPKLKITRQDKNCSSAENQQHQQYSQHFQEDPINSGNKTFPKLILKHHSQQQQHHSHHQLQNQEHNLPSKFTGDEKSVPKLTIKNSGAQASNPSDNIDSGINNNEKIPKLVIKQNTAGTSSLTSESLDEVDKLSMSKISMKDIQFNEIQNVPQTNDFINYPKVVIKDFKQRDPKIKALNESNNSSLSPILEKRLKSQIKNKTNKRLSPTMQYLNTDCSPSSQENNDNLLSNCLSEVVINDCEFILQNASVSNELSKQNSSLLHNEGPHRIQDYPIMMNELNKISPNTFSCISSIQNQEMQQHRLPQQLQQQEPVETVDLTDTPSPGASPNPEQMQDNSALENYNLSKRFNNQLMYEMLKSAKNAEQMNAEKNRSTGSYSLMLNGQHASTETQRQKLDDLLMQNEITNDSNSFIVNHFQQDPSSVENDILSQNNNTERNKDSHNLSANSLKRKSEENIFNETGGNGDCANDIPYKRTKDNLIGANQIIETSTTSLSSFEVCLKMTTSNCLPNMNNIPDTISLPDSESDNIMLCDTGTNSLDGTKFCTVTDFESIESIDDDEEIVEILPPPVTAENKINSFGSAELKHQKQNDNNDNLPHTHKTECLNIGDIVDLTDDVCGAKETSVIVQNQKINHKTPLLEENLNISILKSNETQQNLDIENLLEVNQGMQQKDIPKVTEPQCSIEKTNKSDSLKVMINTTVNILSQEQNQNSNLNNVPELNNSKASNTPTLVKRARGRPRKIVSTPTNTENSVEKPKRRSQVSMLLEEALNTQVYKNQTDNLIQQMNKELYAKTITEQAKGNFSSENNLSQRGCNTEPQTPEKSRSSSQDDDMFQTPQVFATPMEYSSEPATPSNFFGENYESQGSETGNEELTPTRRGRGRGRGFGRGRARGRGRGSRGGRGRQPYIPARKPIGGLTHTPNPNLIRERNFSQEIKAKNLLDSSSIQVFEEDTRMSADSSLNQRQTEFLNDENSQSSVLSSTSILDQSMSSIKKRAKLEVYDPEGKTEYPVDRIAEYDWPPPKGCCPDRNRETYMIQEQIAEYLGIKSFKRKYPDLFRRQVDMEERNYLRERGLVTEKMCDLGITAVLAWEVLDIMYLDFYDKYEEYKNYLRQKHLKEIETKQKGLSHNIVDKSLQIRDRALQSASKWNKHFNNERKEDRRMCIDLQTYVINKPLPRTAAGTVACMGKLYRPMKESLLPKKVPTAYPLALIPGQYGENYKKYTPEELRRLPINTITESPILETFKSPPVIRKETIETEVKIEDLNISDIKEQSDEDDIKDVKPVVVDQNIDQEDTEHCDSNSSSSESETDSDTETETNSESSEDESPDSIVCVVCNLPQTKNPKGRPEVCIECYTCRRTVHPSCIEMTTGVLNRILSYNWQCVDCKCCIKCKRNVDRNKMLFCEQCDRAYHIYCINIKTIPERRWSCERCSVCRRCGATDPIGNLPTPLLSPITATTPTLKKPRRNVKWHNEYRIDNITKLREHANILCFPCSRIKTTFNSVTENNNNSNLLTTVKQEQQHVRSNEVINTIKTQYSTIAMNSEAVNTFPSTLSVTSSNTFTVTSPAATSDIKSITVNNVDKTVNNNNENRNNSTIVTTNSDSSIETTSPIIS